MSKRLVCLAAVLWAACGSEGTSYVPCPNGDADCPANQTCVQGECRPANACTNDDQCTAPRICLNSFCRLPLCSADTDCPGTQHCAGGRCQEGECRVDADCGAGKRCVDYACQTAGCAKDADCSAGELCLEGKCAAAPACSKDSDCPEGTVCESGRCARPCTQDSDCTGTIPKLCRDGHCRQRCLSDATCLGGLICQDGACVEPYCKSDADCTGEFVRCRSGRCQQYTPCTRDGDCPANYYCLNNICEELPRCAIDNDCRNQTICRPAGCVCRDSHCHPAKACQKEEDCGAQEDCIGGICVPFVCRGPEDCPANQVCSGGKCIPAADPQTVYQVIILNAGGPIRSGQQIQLQALALKINGDALPGILFDWKSSQSQRAAVDQDGLLTGGSEAGDTLVTATARGSQPPVVSSPVVFTNMLEAPADTLRVTVIDRLSGSPVSQAVIWVDDSDAIRQESVSDTNGMALLGKPDGRFNLHVFSAQHDFVSFYGISTLDVLVTLPLRSSAAKAGGFTGQMTFSGTGEVSLGLAGASMSGQLVDLNFNGLLGDMFTITMNIPGYGSFNVSLPGRMVAMAEYQGFPFSIKPTYYVEAERGLHTAWGLGGKLSSSTLQNIIGSGSTNDILARLLPYFALFNHGLKPRVDIFPLPKVADGNDIDGDGNTTEMRPDWTSFQNVNLSTLQSQELAVEVAPPSVPSQVGANNLVLIAGSWQRPQGLTPLGLTSQSVGAGGAVQPLVMKLAPMYGGLETGRYLLAALAIPATTGLNTSPDVSLVALNFAHLPARVEFASGFLRLFDDAAWSVPTRTMSASSVAGCNLVRSTFRSVQGSWEVYVAQLAPVVFTLPVPPSQFPDPAASATMTLDALRLSGTLTLDDLAGLGSPFSDVSRLDLWLLAASRHQLP